MSKQKLIQYFAAFFLLFPGAPAADSAASGRGWTPSHGSHSPKPGDGPGGPGDGGKKPW